MVLSSFFGKVRGGARSTPALQELTVPGWEMAEWKIAQFALPELSAPVGPPNQLYARCKYTAHAAVVVDLSPMQVQKKIFLCGISDQFWF